MNPVHFVELASLLVLGLFLFIERREGTLRQVLPLGLALIAAAIVGEDSCIRLYGFYDYKPDWNLVIDKMPLMVALIWPFVIISDQRVVFGALGARHPARYLVTGALVTYDACLMEAVAVKAGLWQWYEPGFFGVPLIGVLGWGFFAVVSLWIWDHLPIGRRGWMVLLAPLATHALLLLGWWGGLRWILRGPFPPPAILAVAGLLSLGLCGVVWRYKIRLPPVVMVPRAFAAALFFGLLLMYGLDNLWLVAFVVSFSPPYLLAFQWPGRAPVLGDGREGQPGPA